jgi:hypothetical protein
MPCERDAGRARSYIFQPYFISLRSLSSPLFRTYGPVIGVDFRIALFTLIWLFAACGLALRKMGINSAWVGFGRLSFYAVDRLVGQRLAGARLAFAQIEL